MKEDDLIANIARIVIAGYGASKEPWDIASDALDLILPAIRKEERRRSCRIVREFDAYTPYIVEKEKIKGRKEAICKAIMGDMG